MTGQRRVIARVLSEAIDHPDVRELHRRIAAVDPGISLSTVYRTMKLFQDKGIVERHEFGDSRGHYETVPQLHHDHLINLQTGDVIEFRSEAIERLQEKIARELGFEIVNSRLELYALPLNRKRPAG